MATLRRALSRVQDVHDDDTALEVRLLDAMTDFAATWRRCVQDRQVTKCEERLVESRWSHVARAAEASYACNLTEAAMLEKVHGMTGDDAGGGVMVETVAVAAPVSVLPVRTCHWCGKPMVTKAQRCAEGDKVGLCRRCYYLQCDGTSGAVADKIVAEMESDARELRQRYSKGR